MSDPMACPLSEWTSSTVTVTARDGLHARPVIRLSRTARRFAAHIQVSLSGENIWVDGKSVARLMGLRVENGQRIDLRARGTDAEAALAALVALVERDFTEEGGQAE